MRCARLISLLVGSIAVASAAQAGGYNWSGLYLGAHGGYGWADTDYPGQPAYPSGPPRPNLEGGLVGGQVGYNVQLTNVVLGVEADYSFTQMSDTTRDGNYLTQDHENIGSGQRSRTTRLCVRQFPAVCHRRLGLESRKFQPDVSGSERRPLRPLQLSQWLCAIRHHQG